MSMQYTAGTSHVDATALKYFAGIAVTETAGSTSRVTVRDGGASGTVVLDLRPASLATSQVFPADAIQFPSGIYVKVESGAVQIALMTC